MVTSCQQKTPKPTKWHKWQDTMTTGLIQIACDQTFEPVIDAQIAVFEAIYDKAGISPIYTDEVEAIQLLIDDSVRLAVTARGFTENERAILTNKKMIIRELKIAVDAIALIVNKENGESFIGIPTLKKILTGEITEWKQINPKSKLGKISVMFDNTNSSTVRYAIDSICRGQPLSERLYAQNNNQEVFEMAAQVPGSIGIIGVNWISNEDDSTQLSFNDKIKVLAVSKYASPDQYNSFLPFQYQVALNKYPMTRDVYILLTDPKSGLSSGFATFVTSDRGQRIVLKSGLVPAIGHIRIREVNVRDENPY